MDWKFFWAGVVGNIILLGGLFYLLKRLIEKKITEDTKRYEHTLSRALEEFKGQLNKEHSALQHCFDTTLAAFTNRNSVLTTKQAEVLGEMHSRIYDAWSRLFALRYARDADIDTLRNEAATACDEAIRYFRPRRIYLPKELCEKTHNLINKMARTCDDYYNARKAANRDTYETAKVEIESLSVSVMPLIAELEQHFRDLLSGTSDTIK